MTRPAITETDLHAWLDGELAQERRVEVEAYLAAHPEDAARLEEYRRNDRALELHFQAAIEESVPERFARRGRPRSRRVLVAGAAVGLVFAGVVAGWYLHALRGASPDGETPSWAHRAAVAHAVYSPEVRHPVEVAADQEAHLAAWLSKRLGTPLRIPQLEPLNYALVGGRLLPGDQGPVAQFMYQDGQGHRLTLYVRTNREHSGETAFRFAQDGNVRQFYWIDRGLGYALSGEIGKDDLLRVATAVHRQLNP